MRFTKSLGVVSPKKAWAFASGAIHGKGLI